METIGSKRSYALTWCMPNNDDDDQTMLFSCYIFLMNSVKADMPLHGKWRCMYIHTYKHEDNW